MCKIAQGVWTGRSTFRPLGNSQDQHIHLELQESSTVIAMHTLGVYPICIQFW